VLVLLTLLRYLLQQRCSLYAASDCCAGLMCTMPLECSSQGDRSECQPECRKQSESWMTKKIIAIIAGTAAPDTDRGYLPTWISVRGRHPCDAFPALDCECRTSFYWGRVNFSPHPAHAGMPDYPHAPVPFFFPDVFVPVTLLATFPVLPPAALGNLTRIEYPSSSGKTPGWEGGKKNKPAVVVMQVSPINPYHQVGTAGERARNVMSCAPWCGHASAGCVRLPWHVVQIPVRTGAVVSVDYRSATSDRCPALACTVSLLTVQEW
jgi:hypothetical protein